MPDFSKQIDEMIVNGQKRLEEIFNRLPANLRPDQQEILAKWLCKLEQAHNKANAAMRGENA